LLINQRQTGADPVADLPRILRAASALGLLSESRSSAPRVLATLCDPRVTNSAISSLISQDPGLAVRVLKVANSSYYGYARSVTTIERALCLIGLNAVRGIAAMVCFDATVMRTPAGGLIPWAAFVSHSLAVGTAAETLAKIQCRELAGDAFMAGLLHNLGVPIQAMLDPLGVQGFIASLALSTDQNVREVEQSHGLIGHEACAVVVFENWGLPASLMDAAAHHHHPSLSPVTNQRLTWLVHFGLHLAAGAGFRFPGEPMHAVRSAGAMAKLGLCDALLDETQKMLPDRLSQLQNALAGSKSLDKL
jgi:HD-like signal output (HDOD) protein